MYISSSSIAIFVVFQKTLTTGYLVPHKNQNNVRMILHVYTTQNIREFLKLYLRISISINLNFIHRKYFFHIYITKLTKMQFLSKFQKKKSYSKAKK